MRGFYLDSLLMQMCRDRGYSVDETDLTMNLEEFKSRFGDAPMYLLDALSSF